MKIVRPAASSPREPRPLPIQEAVRDTLGDLLGRTCSVSKAAAPTEVAFLGVFSDKDGNAIAGLGGDFAFAAYTAAALAMVPAPTAREQVEARALDETLRECFYEVTNVLSRLFNGESVSHLKLTALIEGSDPQVAELQGGASRHLDVLIDGYGNARVGLFAIG